MVILDYSATNHERILTRVTTKLAGLSDAPTLAHETLPRVWTMCSDSRSSLSLAGGLCWRRESCLLLLVLGDTVVRTGRLHPGILCILFTGWPVTRDLAVPCTFVGDWHIGEMFVADDGHVSGVLPFIPGLGQYHDVGEYILVQYLVFETLESR